MRCAHQHLLITLLAGFVAGSCDDERTDKASTSTMPASGGPSYSDNLAFFSYLPLGGLGEHIFPPPIPPIDDPLPIAGEDLGPPPLPFGLCGNGIRELQEHCDDGNRSNYDDCNVICQFPYCGNGITENDEECDDWDNNDGNGCNAVCQFERCGNGRLDFVFKNSDTDFLKEECDDGNDEGGDGCTPCCTFEKCGNGIIDCNEECDEGVDPPVDGPNCDSHCKIPEVAQSGSKEKNMALAATSCPHTRSCK